MVPSGDTIDDAAPSRRGLTAALVEALLIAIVFYLATGSPPPDINEPNYLAKAKHFWNPAWAAGDLFLESADAHLVFYASFGWVTRCADLETSAWIGRWSIWIMMAIAWVALARALRLPKGAALIAAALFLIGNRYGQLSGEWVVGGCEAKGFAYAAVILALAAIVERRFRLALVALGVATAWHVLVGGWTLVALVIAWSAAALLRRRLFGELGLKRAPRAWLAAVVAAVGFALLGVWPVMAMNAGVPANVAQEAARIMVQERLPHHLLPEGFTARSGWHLLLIAVWIAGAVAVRRHSGASRLNAIALGTLVLSLIGFALDAATADRPDLRWSLMRLYWFRSADALVPLAAAVSLITLAVTQPSSPRRRALLIAISLPAVLLLARMAQENLDATRPRGEIAWDPYSWQQACAWIDDNAPPEAICLTPLFDLTFKWYGARAEVATWKEMPQDARSIVAWWARINDVYGSPAGQPPGSIQRFQLSLANEPPERLQAAAARYGATYLVTWVEPQLALPRVYRNNSYAVYRVGP